MKKVLLSAVAVIAFGVAQAQELKFGVKAGLNVANLSGDGAKGASSRTGLHIGGLAEYKLTDKFAVQAELLYSMQGAEIKGLGGFDGGDEGEERGVAQGFDPGDFADFGGKTEMKLDYISLPILAKYYVIEGLSLEAGPQFAFLMSAKQGSIDAKSNFKGMDMGLAAGAGYELPMGVFFQARYVAGLSKANDKGADIKNSVFQISAGYKF